MSDTSNTVDTDVGGAPAEDAFDAQFASFLSHSFDEPEEVEGGEDTATGGETTPAAAGANTVAGGNGADTIEAGAGNATEVAPNADGKSQQASGEDQVDPALLAEMAGLASPQGQSTETTPEGQAGGDSQTATDMVGEKFMPFTPTFDLPPAIVQGLFEAEDTETRQKSLVGVLSAFGNTTTSVMAAYVERRIGEELDRRMAQTDEGNLRTAVTTHFYGKFPELNGYRPAVQKAFAVIAARNPGVAYSEETAAQVANLAKAALAQSGVKFAAPATTVKTPPVKTPTRKAPGNAFDAGGARPGGGLQAPADAGPGELVDQLRDYGFS